MVISHQWVKVAIPLFVIVGCTNQPQPEQMLRVALAWGRLANLPEQASELKVDTIGNTFSRTFYLKFKASPQEIQTFVLNSPGLKQVKPEFFNQQRHFLPYPENGEQLSSEHTYFHPEKRLPWFNPTVSIKGRRYIIPQDQKANGGELIIDDARHIVYVKVSHS